MTRTILVLVLTLLAPALSPAVTVVWTNAGTGVWSDASNWAPVPPASEDDVFITNAGANVYLAGPVTVNSLRLGGPAATSTLTFTNWDSFLTASTLVIASNGLITLPPAFTNVAQADNVWLVCTTLTVEAGGAIDVSERGYGPAPSGQGAVGFGPGGGPGTDGGAHGGRGGWVSANTYDAAAAPLLPGSGGGCWDGVPGKAGGGAVRIQAAEAVLINGRILANGGSQATGYNSGGSGSGGSISIACRTLSGTNGVLSAYGGSSTINVSAGGGGGRIAVLYDTAAQSAMPPPAIQFNAMGGASRYNSRASTPGEPGTIYFNDTLLLTEFPTQFNGQFLATGFTNWTPNNLTVSNVWLGFPEITLSLTNDLIVRTNGTLVVTNTLTVGHDLTVGGTLTVRGPLSPSAALNLPAGGTLTCQAPLSYSNDLTIAGGLSVVNPLSTNLLLWCGSGFIVTNGGSLYLYSGNTNGASTRYGGLVSVTNGDFALAANAAVYPYSSAADGGAVLFQVRNLALAPNASINASGLGFAPSVARGRGTGPGAGTNTSAGSYGGKGGGGQSGATYGSSNAPIVPGSAGGTWDAQGGAGGGAVWIDASGSVQLGGTISADGNQASGTAGAGSGGGICIQAAAFAGSGTLSATGATWLSRSDCAGGGGGRIAIGIGLSDAARTALVNGQAVDRLTTYRHHASFTGTMTVANGTDASAVSPLAQPGTAHFMTTNYVLSVAALPSSYGSPKPDGYGDWIHYADDSLITNAVASPADEAGGVRHSCIGWNLACVGIAFSNGVDTQTVFQLTNSLLLNWNWTNEYQLTVGAGLHGTVNSGVVNGWYTNGLVVTGILAQGDSEYRFDHWIGASVPSGQEYANPLTATMTQARTDIVASFASSAGETNTWSGVGDWSSATNWSLLSVPGLSDTAIIGAGTCALHVAQSAASVIIGNGGVLLVTNWNTTLTASNVSILTNGLIALPAAFATNQMSNSVTIQCTNLLIDAGGKIDVTERGYAGAPSGQGAVGYGPGGGAGTDGGAHGGRGGWASSAIYGLTNAPVAPGSGGGCWDGVPGKAGGGVVRIQAANAVVINGRILANGGSQATGGNSGGSGAGGSIYITCRTFDGTNGLLSANGGSSSVSIAGGGGGGRIAVVYDPAAQLALPIPAVVFSALGGTSRWYGAVSTPGEPGTLYFGDTALLSESLTQFNGQFYAPGFTTWYPNNLAVNDSWLKFPATTISVTNAMTVGSNATLVVTNVLTVGGSLAAAGILDIKGPLVLGGTLALPAGGSLSMLGDWQIADLTAGGWLTVGGTLRVQNGLSLPASGGVSCYAPFQYTNDMAVSGTFCITNPLLTNMLLLCGRNLTVTNGGKLYIYSGTTNGPAPRYGGLLSVNGDLRVAGNSTLYPYSHPTNGGSVLLQVRNLTVATNGAINADGKGFAGGSGTSGIWKPGFGPGGGGARSGGGYGGTGAGVPAGGGATFGYSNAPAMPGSGGGGWDTVGGAGGGLVWIEASGTVTIDGSLTANGLSPSGRAGAGSGGGICINAARLTGGGTFAANGANGTEAGFNGGGGGGRIVVGLGLAESVKQALLDGQDLRHLITFRQSLDFGGTMSVTNGTGGAAPAQPGTAYFIRMKYTGTVFFAR